MDLKVVDDSQILLKKSIGYEGWKDFACGWGAAFINICITFPVNKIIFRQMIHGMKVNNAAQQLYNEGIYFLYRGLLPPLMQKTLSLSIMFGMYEQVRRPLIREYQCNPYFAKTTGGMVAGTVEAVLMPFERIQTLLVNSKYHGMYKNTYQAFKLIGANYGFREYYRGLTPILLRNGPSNVCFFIIREEVQERFPKDVTKLEKSLYEFLNGAIIGATLSTLFYPLNVIKFAMQSQVGGRNVNILECFMRIYRERGCRISNMYYGVNVNITRAFLSWGVMSSAYENLKILIY